MPALVEQIETTPKPTNTRVVFAYDTDAESIVVPELITVDTTTMTNLSYCFYKCSKLTSLTLLDGFGGCASNLSYCFDSCSKLTSLTLPNGFG